MLIISLYYFLVILSFLLLYMDFRTATEFDGIFLFTTLPAPITTLLPIFTPGKTTTLPPIHTSSPTSIGFAYSRPLFLVSESIG